MSTIKVNKIENTATADGGIAIDASGHVTVDGQQLPTAGPLSNRNLADNGAFQIFQRATSVTGLTDAGYKTADRWRVNSSGGTYNQSRQTVPLGDSTVGDFKYFLRHEATTGDDYHGILQRIEDVQTVPAGTITISFYAKGTNPNGGSLQITTTQYFGSGGSPSSNVNNTAQTFTLTSSWQRFDFQFTIASLSGKTLGTNNDSYFQYQITQPNDDDSADAWTLDITGVQLEVGSVATPFEHRSYGDELQRCLRYYEENPTTQSLFRVYPGGSSVAVAYSYIWNVEKRVAPTVTIGSKSPSSFAETIDTHGAYYFRSGSVASYSVVGPITADAEL